MLLPLSPVNQSGRAVSPSPAAIYLIFSLDLTHDFIVQLLAETLPGWRVALLSCLCVRFKEALQVTFVYVWLLFTLRPRLPFSRCSSPEMPSSFFFFFLDLKRFGLFLTYFQHAGAARRVAIQLWSVLNCRGSNSHKKDSYLCSRAQSADSTDFKDHLKRCEEREEKNCLQSSYLFKRVKCDHRLRSLGW